MAKLAPKIHFGDLSQVETLIYYLSDSIGSETYFKIEVCEKAYFVSSNFSPHWTQA